MSTQELAEGVFTVAVGDHRTLFVASDQGVVALNSFGSADATRAYLEAIQGVCGHSGPSLAIATIDHLDHSGNTAGLGQDVKVVAHELCAAVMERRAVAGQRRADHLIRGDGDELELCGERFALRYPGPTQGTGNLAVHLPERRVLFLAGPRADARYGLLPDFHLRHVTRIWRELAGLGVDVVVPARGPLMTPAQLARAA
ncbi:MAG: hypothetical protein JO244_10585, partial [Solirubrobacterales bacterium]|nr:hypothetical protein [Solirubrobacterales bacterium]